MKADEKLLAFERGHGTMFNDKFTELIKNQLGLKTLTEGDYSTKTGFTYKFLGEHCYRQPISDEKCEYETNHGWCGCHVKQDGQIVFHSRFEREVTIFLRKSKRRSSKES